MLVAQSDPLGRVYSGPEIGSQNIGTQNSLWPQDFRCPLCGKRVAYDSSPGDCLFEYFKHSDGSRDCFETNSGSDGHRFAMEVAVKTLHNRIREVTGESVNIDVERWIGDKGNFIITDVRVVAPLQIAAEVYYKTERLGLGRRLEKMFANDYRAYLIFHKNGRHNVNRVGRYIQRVAPLRVGRFDPENLELTLGDLFTERRINLKQSNRNRLPNYIAR